MRIIGNDPSTPRQAQIVASGTLPSGKPVVVNSDGTVSAAGVVSDVQSVGTATVFASSSADQIASTYAASSNKVVVVYSDNGNSGYGTAVLGTVSGGSISFETPVVFNSGDADFPSVAYDQASDKIVVGYKYLNRGYAIVGTISGASLSFGTAVQFSNAASDADLVYHAAEQKIVIAYSGTSAYTYTIVGTVSGTSISFGTAVLVDSNNSSFEPQISYDTINEKVAVFYASAGDVGTVSVGTVSGTSITFGTAVTFTPTVNIQYGVICYDSFSQKIVCAYGDKDAPRYGYAIVGTISGTSVSFGSPVLYASVFVRGTGIVYDENARKVVIGYRDDTNNNVKAVAGEVSGTSITFGSTAVIRTSDTTDPIGMAYDTTSKKVVISYRDVTNSGYGTSSVFQAAYSVPNLTSENYIGTAATGAPSGTRAKINLKGAVADFDLKYYYTLGASYDDVSFTDGNLDFPLSGIFFKPDGTGLFITENSDDRIYSFPLTTPWDLTTKGSTSFMSSPSTTPTGIFFKPDGTKMYVNDSGTDLIYEYSLSTAWDLSSASQTDTFSTTLANPYGLTFKPDGTKFYIVNEGVGVQEFSMSSAWDLTTAAVTSGATLAITDSGGSSGVQFNDDGTELFVIGYVGDGIYRYILSTAYDITTATYADFKSVAAQATSPRGLFFKSDGSKLYVLDAAADSVFQYSSTSALTAGQSYYVQTDGTLSTTAGDPSVFAGTAVAANKLIVKG